MGGVDGEHKVDVGWLNEAVDGGSQKGMNGPGWGRRDGGKGVSWMEEKSGGTISKQRPQGLLEADWDSSSINGPLASTRSNTWNSDD